MPTYYLEPAALLKRYRREAGSEVLHDLFVGKRSVDRFVTSHFAILEISPRPSAESPGRLQVAGSGCASSGGAGCPRGLERRPTLAELLAEGASMVAGGEVVSREARLYPLGTAVALAQVLRHVGDAMMR